HFMIFKPGFKTLVSQIYVPDDEHLNSDVQFGVTRALIGAYIRHDEADGLRGFAPPWYSLNQRFVLEQGDARRPRGPIRAQASRQAGRARASRSAQAQIFKLLGAACWRGIERRKDRCIARAFIAAVPGRGGAGSAGGAPAGVYASN